MGINYFIDTHVFMWGLLDDPKLCVRQKMKADVSVTSVAR